MKSLHVKSGDTVLVRSGNDRGKQGKVLEVSPKEKKVIVEGINKVKKHVKPRQMGEAGGIIEAEAPMYATKVQLVCPKCKKPTRLAHKFVDEKGKQTKKRVCKKCEETF